MADRIDAGDVLYLHLGNGRENAESLGSLAERLRWPRRHVELAVTTLRRRGLPVASDGHGVWVGSPADLAQTAASLQRRLVQQYVTLRAVRQTLARMRAAQVQQTTMWDLMNKVSVA